MKQAKRMAYAIAAAAVSITALTASYQPTEMDLSAQAADFSYPVQEFRIGIGDTDRNVNISGMSSGDHLNSWTTNGARNEKWYLNYISDGVYEIVNSATGYVITNQNGLAVLAPDTDAASQRWQIIGTDKDHEGYYLYYKIVSNADSSVGLTFSPDSNSISVAAYNGDLYQKFKLNLDGLEGFAANSMVSQGEKAGVIGGLLGKTVIVTTVDDFKTALNSTEPLTIVVNGSFDMQSEWHTRIRDYKTIVGSYAANTLQDCYLRTNNEYGTEGDEPSDNIVIRNIDFEAVNVEDRILVNIWSSRNIWIDHCTFNSLLDRDKDEVGKFIWINTPYESYMDAKDNGRSPDYITISYCTFANRYWTVAYGTQNSETTRCRTTLMFNLWDQCVRRCPQIGNGIGHIYNSYFVGSESGNDSGTAQIIGGDGSNMISENCRFESLTGKEITAGGSSNSPYRDSGSYTAVSSSATPTLLNFNPSYPSSLYPNRDNYGYSLIAAYNTSGTDTKDFCTAYAGDAGSYSELKYITDADMTDYVATKYPNPFLRSVEVGDALVDGAAVMNTDVTYSFQNLSSGLYLEVAGSTAESGANVQQGNSGAMEWTLTDAGDGYYYIYSTLADGRTYVLDLAYGNTENGTNIGIWTNSSDDAKMFRFLDNGDGTYTITTKSTDNKSCIGIYGGSSEIGANALQWQRDGSDNQKWVAAINGSKIKHLIVSDDATRGLWRIDSSAAVGDLVFSDRDASYTSLPDALIGAEMIQTACDAKNRTGTLASFIAGADLTVYVALDARISAVPAWLSEWTKTDLTVDNSKDVTFELYARSCRAGEKITLGTNGQSSGCVNYTVFAANTAVQGDVNSDGVCSIADLVMLQKYIIRAGELTAPQAADLNTDQRVNAMDLALLKQLFI